MIKARIISTIPYPILEFKITLRKINAVRDEVSGQE